MTRKRDGDEIKSGFSLLDFYKNNYKKFLILPAVLFFLSIVFVFVAVSNDGTPIYRDVSLKGGLSAAVTVDTEETSQSLQTELENSFAGNSFSVSDLSSEGERVGFIIDTDLEESLLMEFVSDRYDVELEFSENYSSNFISPTLSGAFFKQAVYILVISLVLMSGVIFIYFREFVPSIAVVLSAIFDLIVTVGVLNLMEFKVSIAGIGALLMILGYSIDTDILLTNRVFKERGDDYFEKTGFAFKTGVLMSVTTLLAGICALIITNSDVIFEIALILIIGLVVDFISTWCMNASVLLWWLNSKDKN